MSRVIFLCLGLVFWVTPFVQRLLFAQYDPGIVGTRAIHAGGTPFGIATADLNHDGIPDIVIADGSTTTVDARNVRHTAIHGIAVLLGTPGGGSRPVMHFATADSASFATVADVDGDGNPDVITASDDPNLLGPGVSPGGSMEVLRGRGDGTFGAPTKYSFSSPSRYAVAIYPGDLNNDGHIDLVVALTNAIFDGNSTVYMLNNGDGTFRKGFDTIGPMPVAVADFNHDGKLDVAAFFYHSRTPNTFGVFYGNGGESFGGVSNMVGVPPIAKNFGVTVADFNGDGYLDLAYISDDSNQVTVLVNNTGLFSAKAFLPPGSGLAGIVAGDFNHDGHVDLAIIDSHARLSVYFGHGDGTFAYPAMYTVGGTGVLMREVLAVADLNRDGNLDVAAVGTEGSYIPVFGKPGGTFNAATERLLSTGAEPVDSVSADFNGDGIPDIAVLNAGANPTVEILRGDGTGRFKLSPQRAPTGISGTAIAAGDINGDGKMDLVVRNDPAGFNNAELAILLGHGDGTFAAAMFSGTIPSGFATMPQESTPLYIADANNDGKLDVISYVGVHLGHGDGTFGAAIPFPDANYLFALGDFNKDGKLDLVTLSDARTPELNVYLGSGNGHFSAGTYSVTLPFGDLQHNFLTVGHFTRDGNLGVLAGSDRQFYPDQTVIENGAFSFLAGNGDGTLKAPAIYQLSQQLWKLAAVDYNNDGVDDVAAFNSNFYQVAQSGPGYNVNLLSLFTSKGDGTLGKAVSFGAGAILFDRNPGKIPIADFNRDGAVDIAGLDVGETIMLNSRGTSVGLGASPASGKAGQSITLKCTVKASFHFSGALYGRVTFYDRNNALGTVDILHDSADLTISSLGPGTHSLTATFLGNGNYNAHRSNAVTVVIAP